MHVIDVYRSNHSVVLFTINLLRHYTVCYVTGNDADVSLLSGAAVGAEVHDEGQEQ